MTHAETASIVIVGGGAVGCGVAHSLAAAGYDDILLIEKEPTLAAATTSQAAGLVGQVRNSLDRTRLAMWSVQTFSDLESGDTARPGWRQVGSLRLALCDERVEEFRRMQAVADEAGLETRFLDNDEAATLWPAMRFDKVRAVLWCPTDGYLQPSDLAMAYVARARQAGVRFHTGTAVQKVLVDGDRVVGVETSKHRVSTPMVINAAGAHAWHLAHSVGVELPIVPIRHEFFVTVAADGLVPELPVIRIPDATLYLRAETDSLLCGGWEPSSLSLAPNEYPIDGQPPPVREDWDVLASFAEQLAPQFPQVSQLGIRSVFRGWPTFTPDGRFIIGESNRLKGLVMAGGCNAHGVSGSAGIGRHVVESIGDNPSPYVASLSPDRFTDSEWNWTEASAQARRVYEHYYSIDH
ncbi:MAG: FAD-dependent oxidoreductase [Planctomycetota bacterium]|nr:FAD-dependent oxidoreductase [Planctomycetota bacterium]